MPARTDSTMKASKKRFELPALDFKFGSLTEGTDIPPPPPSPTRELAKPGTAPKSVVAPKQETEKPSMLAVTNGKTNVSPPNPFPTGTKRPANDYRTSPTSLRRQGSIVRLFSRASLNSAYQDGERAAASTIQRPGSRLSTVTTTTTTTPDAKKKRSSGWFSRLRSSDGTKKTTSVPMSPTIYEEKKKPTGPPPPMIPALTRLNQESTLGDDLFKDIK